MTTQPKASVKNTVKLILDVTCAPADIHYPTDIWLLNGAREALEEIIGVLHQPLIGTCKKPRTYRECARKDYLNIEKKRRLTAKMIRKAVGHLAMNPEKRLRLLFFNFFKGQFWMIEGHFWMLESEIPVNHWT